MHLRGDAQLLKNAFKFLRLQYAAAFAPIRHAEFGDDSPFDYGSSFNCLAPLSASEMSTMPLLLGETRDPPTGLKATVGDEQGNLLPVDDSAHPAAEFTQQCQVHVAELARVHVRMS